MFNITLSDGSLLIKDKTLTGFSNSEEIAAELADHMPYLTEDVLKSKGANYVKAEQDFTPFAVTDGRLVTGQNPQIRRSCRRSGIRNSKSIRILNIEDLKALPES